MKRAVLLGGSGFIGRWLTRSLSARGYEVVVVDRRRPAEPVSAWVDADARDRKALGEAVSSGDVVVHLFHSSIPTESMDDPEAEHSENVAPFTELVATLVEIKPSVLVYSSTGGQIYGEVDQLLIQETQTCNPVSEYGKSKLRMEQIARAASDEHGLPFLIVRVSNPYGPYQELTNRHGVIPHLCRAAIKQSPFTVYGHGATVRDYVYVQDTAEAITSLIDGGVVNQVVNVGAGVGTSLADLIHMVEQAVGASIKTVDAPIRVSDVRHNALDVSLLQNLCGFSPLVSLDEGLRRVVAYMREHEKA